MKISRRLSGVFFPLLLSAFSFVPPAQARQPQPAAIGPGSIKIVADTTVHLLVTSPAGLKTGFDPSSDQDVIQIPLSDYYTGAGSGNNSSGGASTPAVKRLDIPSPASGEYILEAIGAQSGPFKLQVTAYDSQGKGSGASFVGTATLGATFLYAIAYSPVRGAQVSALAPFSRFHATVNVYSGQPPSFMATADIHLGAGSTGFNPLTDRVYFRLASYSVTIPPGSFTEDKQGDYHFHGEIQSVPLVVRIAPELGGKFALRFKVQVIDLTAAINPLRMVLILGRNAGAKLVNAAVR